MSDGNAGTVANTGATACPACGTQVSPGLLSCPNCRRLVRADRLKQLADDARRAEAEGALGTALALWGEALPLLPPSTKQAEAIMTRIADLRQRVGASPTAAPQASALPDRAPERGKWSSLAGVGTLLLLVAGKAKFLLLGLTKGSTFLTMFAAVGVYWTEYGWRLALGLVLSIYVHEMGHVAALMRYGIRASAPLFLPGIGAVVRLQQALTDPRQDARVGLAGPLWGLGAALASYAVFLAGGPPVFAAVAKLGAWVNLFNLTPVWQLDGGRAFNSLTRPQRWAAATAVAVSWSLTGEGILLLLLVVAAIKALADRPAARPDHGALALYAGLVATLSAVTLIPVPLP